MRPPAQLEWGKRDLYGKRILNQPCHLCDGNGEHNWGGAFPDEPFVECCLCDGTGKLTLEVELQCQEWAHVPDNVGSFN